MDNTDKRRNNKNNITLDSKHRDIISKFKNNKEIIPQKQKELDDIKKKIKELSNKNNINYETIYELEEKAFELENDINTLQSGIKESEYFLRTNDILLNYYQENNKVKYEDSDSDDNNENVDIIIKDGHSRAEILNNYLSIVEPKLVETSIENSFICSHCHIDLDVNYNDGYIECTNCGYYQDYLYSSDKPNYKDTQPEISSYSYKRINHYQEWLNQFQAKESTSIPDDVFDLIYNEIKKHRITDLSKVSPKLIKDFLKKLKLNKYYEHTTYIINRLNGRSAPKLPREIEEILKAMFREIQIPFMRHTPQNRKNFLSYAYTLHKFMELLILKESQKEIPDTDKIEQFRMWKNYFPLLKSRQKLIEQDNIWMGICSDLKWSFIPSI